MMIVKPKYRKIVAIGASAGGPPALRRILPMFPKDFPLGILIVQHMPANFTAHLAEALDKSSQIKVKEAEHNDGILKSVALIAPGSHYMVCGRGGSSRAFGNVLLQDPDPEITGTIHSISINTMFESVAERFGNKVIAVIMTGMGSDGVRGIKKIKEEGGITIAQDESSSMVFGMAERAIEAGAIDKVVSLDNIVKEILKDI